MQELSVITFVSLAILSGIVIVPAFGSDNPYLECPDCNDTSNIQQIPSTPITVTTDKPVYDHNSQIMVTGHVANSYPGQDVAMKITSPSGNVTSSVQLAVDNNGDFITMISPVGNFWSENGQYTITVQQGDEQARVNSAVFQLTDTPISGQTVNEIDIATGAGSSINTACVATNNCFTPNPLTVTPGTTVTWMNTDTIMHVICSGKSTDTSCGTVFEDDSLKPGHIFQVIFKNSGTYDYFCAVHPWMTGQVIVSGNVSYPSPTISVMTDKSSYKQGDAIVLTGHVTNMQDTSAITLRVLNSNQLLISLAQLVPSSDGSFTKTISTGPLWNDAGTYTVVAQYGSVQTTDTFYFGGQSSVTTPPPTSGSDSWYPGKGLKQGDYFSYAVCWIDWHNCTPLQLKFWVKNETIDGSGWNVVFMAIDGSNVQKGIMTIGKITPDPTSFDSNISDYAGVYRSTVSWLDSFATKDKPKTFNIPAWGRTGAVGGQSVGPISYEKVTVGAGTFDTYVLGWHKGVDNKIWIDPSIPFPVKAIVYADVVPTIPPLDYNLELLQYGNSQTEPYFVIVTSSSSLLQSQNATSTQSSTFASTSIITPTQQNIDAINQAKASKIIAAEVNVGTNQSTTIDNNVSVQTTQNTPDSLGVNVSANDQTGPKIIAFNLATTTINVANLKDLGVMYDGKLIQPAPNMDAILHAKPTDNPSFAIVVTQSGVQVLVLIPHFSTHNIIITNMSKVIIPAVPEFGPIAGAIIIISVIGSMVISKRFSRL